MMGLDLLVARAGDVLLGALLERLAAAGLPSVLAMVDGTLLAFGQPPPDRWQDARLRTPAGTVTLRRAPEGVRVVVFGNADAALLAAQRTVAAALEA